MAKGSVKTYMAAVASLQSFTRSCNRDPLPADDTLLYDWIAFMQTAGLSFKSASLYLNAAAGLYRSAERRGVPASAASFARVKDSLKNLGENRWSARVDQPSFMRLVSLTKAACADTPKQETATTADLLLISLLNGFPLIKSAMLRKEDVCGLQGESLSIAERNISPSRKYIFSLGQSAHTPRQLTAELNASVSALLSSRGITSFGSADETMASHWAYAALRYGVPAHAVLAFLGLPPAGMSSLSLLPSPTTPVATATRRPLAEEVGRIFTTNPVMWYVMRLRPHISFDDLSRRFVDLKDELVRPPMFYPYEEITRRIGRKLVCARKPVIDGVVFFRSRVTEIAPMFSSIGDLAWCYRNNGTDGTYAPVSQRQFERFQAAIGQFSPDYEVAPVGGLEIRENDRVVILGGIFTGQEANVSKIEAPAPDGSVIYRMNFFDAQGIEWRVGLDSRMVRRQED